MTSCEDECIVGADKLCTPDGLPRICEMSAEGCGVYNDLAACDSGQECSKGECVTADPCAADVCTVGDRRCGPGDSLEICELTAGNECPEFGVLEPCGANGFVCNATGAFVQCETPPMISTPVVINEIFYNVPGPDVDATSMDSKSYIELKGAPGQSIANWEIKLVNGKNGMAYRTVTLPADATIGSYGYSIITTDKATRFLGFAVFNGTNVYDLIPATSTDDGIQNGPDNVELYDDAGTKVDALGYGDFEAGDTFTGEGTSPGRIFENRSLGRYKNAPDTDDNSVDFVSLFPTPGTDNGDLVINEIYVDQPGTDGEADNIETFIELVAPETDASWIDMDLSQYSLRAINGLDGMDYIFSGTLPGPDFTDAKLQDAARATGDVGAEGYVLICNIEAASSVIGRCSIPYEGVDYQNGPDNIVLEYQGRPIDAVAYGTFAQGQTQAGEGTPVPLSSSSAGKSLNRANDGSRDRDTNDNATDFHLSSPSPAYRNNPAP